MPVSYTIKRFLSIVDSWQLTDEPKKPPVITNCTRKDGAGGLGASTEENGGADHGHAPDVVYFPFIKGADARELHRICLWSIQQNHNNVPLFIGLQPLKQHLLNPRSYAASGTASLSLAETLRVTPGVEA